MTVRLPVLPVTVRAHSNFCAVTIPLDLWARPDGSCAYVNLNASEDVHEDESTLTRLELFVDGNSKITRENGTYEDPRPNALSLPSAAVEWGKSGDAFERIHVLGRSCPGSTSICRSSCYTHGLAKHAPEVYAGYTANLFALERVFAWGEGFATYAAKILSAWILQNAPEGFRWHVSGDVMSDTHAAWIVEVCELAPSVPFWLYTRTLEAVGYLAGTPNLAINVSADRENYEEARRVAHEYAARVCYLSDDGTVPRNLPPGSVIFPDYAHRGRGQDVPTDHAFWQSLTHAQRAMVCPTDFFGQSEAHRCGPCTKCF